MAIENLINIELQSHFLRLYQMACADEHFDVLEMKQLYKFAEQRGLATEHLHHLLVNPVQQLEIPASIEKKVEYLYDLAVMIWADSQVTDDELHLLKKYSKVFGFLEENIDQLCDYLINCAKEDKPLQDVLDTII